MEYRKVYFRIRSRYQFDSGWPAETDAAKFHEESRSLFQSAGWDLQPGGDSTSDTVIKGQQELYLHPMNFSGIIEMDEIPAIQELLKDAKSFRCYITGYLRGGCFGRKRRPLKPWQSRNMEAYRFRNHSILCWFSNGRKMVFFTIERPEQMCYNGFENVLEDKEEGVTEA